MSKAVPSRLLAHTKVVATIGPACEDSLVELVARGMSVARLNFSYDTPDDHRRRIAKVRAAAEVVGRAVSILADLPGPKMRLGRVPGGSLRLAEGDRVALRSSSERVPSGEIAVDVPDLEQVVGVGHRIALADGEVELVVERIEGARILARVRWGGAIADNKGVHLPDSQVPYELPTEEDLRWIEFAVEEGVDMLGLSFVGRAAEVLAIRERAPDLLMVAKIERKCALENLDEILRAADGIMVARGDLGVELELEELPIAQKNIIAAALREKKFSVTATEMLESMIHSNRPTRAEVTDVANAVLDGTDAVMLSAETAIGEHAVEAVATMIRIVRRVERSRRYRDMRRIGFRPQAQEDSEVSSAIAMAAVQVTESLGIDRIVCFTETGHTVRYVSRLRPEAEIVSLSPNPRTVRRMCVLSGVLPLLFEREANLEAMLTEAADMLERTGLAERGDSVVYVAGVPPGVAKSTNLLKLHRIGEEVRLGSGAAGAPAERPL